jgi:hypothetical protein
MYIATTNFMSMIELNPLIFVQYFEDFESETVGWVNIKDIAMPLFLFQIGENNSNSFVDLKKENYQ